VAESIFHWTHSKEGKQLLARLAGVGVTPQSAQKSTGGLWQGQSWVITGSLSSLSREQAEEAVRSQGGTAASSVSSNTHTVVVGESPGSKLEKAKSLGIRIIDEQQFLKELGRQS
jgi:DNA ligase (NAD+)